MMLFSAVAFNLKTSESKSEFESAGSQLPDVREMPVHEVELLVDVRGSFAANIDSQGRLGGVAVTIVVGEIKSSASESGIATTRNQLGKALQILDHHASNAYYGDYLKLKITSLAKIGWICLPKKVAAEARRQLLLQKGLNSNDSASDCNIEIKGY